MPPSYYGTDYNDDEEARTPLVGGNSNSATAASSSQRKGYGHLINRMLVLLTLVGLVILSMYFETQQTQLTQQLQHDEETIAELQSQVNGQAQVIERFNQSVSNSDVLNRLDELQQSMTETQKELQDQLDQTVANVNEQLDETKEKLDQTVSDAKQEISSKVETVKKDFEQYVVRTEDQFSMENSFMVYQLAGTFTLLSCLISMWHMTAHLRKLKQPVIQRKILAILWMSPIYAITSWFSLVFPQAEGYLAIIKDAYEAYIIYQVRV